jgi:hypothetical protein
VGQERGQVPLHGIDRLRQARLGVNERDGMVATVSKHAIDDMKPFGVQWRERRDRFWDPRTRSHVWLSLVRLEVDAGIREEPTKHELNGMSFLKMTDGQLEERCQGCGGWHITDNLPAPPMCVFSPSDFIGPEDR